EVDAEVGDADLRARPARAATRAPQQCLDSSQELEQATWLDDVVVRSEAEAAQLLLLRAQRGHDQDRQLTALVAKPLQHGEAAHRRKHEVQDDEIGLRAPRELESVDAGRRMRHGVSLTLQVRAKGGSVVAVVLDEK